VPAERRITSEADLVGLARALGALDVPPMSAVERALLERAPEVSQALTHDCRLEIRRGEDPLGASFCELREPAQRRGLGATYTPLSIVRAMTVWARRQPTPQRIVDPGTGSGRFLVNAGRLFPAASLVGIEIDPLAALLARAHLSTAGFAARSEVRVIDYRATDLGSCEGRTLFIGNPPYVRHHLLAPRWKQWLARAASRHGLPASGLSGLHVHFFLATLSHARPGDVGAFITSAEWMDVNYGELVRSLLAGPLGATALHVIEPDVLPFPDAQTTAVISCFEVGAHPRTHRVRHISDLAQLGSLEGGRPIAHARLASSRRWSAFARGRRPAQQQRRRDASSRRISPDFVELGELCQVRRGQVTGANRFWIAGEHSAGLPESVLFPTVTRAREVYAAGRVLVDASALRRVIDLPSDLGEFEREERAAIQRLLDRARAERVHEGYIARHRTPWWSVGLYAPAPILATYMARRPPGFVRNSSGARNINIAHGIYPRDETMTEHMLDALVEHLASSVDVGQGRTYAGGLTKFEPGEMERLAVPAPEILAAWRGRSLAS
jgi:hypothetical protein